MARLKSDELRAEFEADARESARIRLLDALRGFDRPGIEVRKYEHVEGPHPLDVAREAIAYAEGRRR